MYPTPACNVNNNWAVYKSRLTIISMEETVANICKQYTDRRDRMMATPALYPPGLRQPSPSGSWTTAEGLGGWCHFTLRRLAFKLLGAINLIRLENLSASRTNRFMLGVLLARASLVFTNHSCWRVRSVPYQSVVVKPMIRLYYSHVFPRRLFVVPRGIFRLFRLGIGVHRPHLESMTWADFLEYIGSVPNAMICPDYLGCINHLTILFRPYNRPG